MKWCLCVSYLIFIPGNTETSIKEFATNAFGILVQENLYNNKDFERITQIKRQIIFKSKDLSKKFIILTSALQNTYGFVERDHAVDICRWRLLFENKYIIYDMIINRP